ncbi:hypothetical protein JTE90_014392 [Oedothorax gibbosus]|uniref:Uncharacterized protein n=1 Tax=Oedothorax gibbosus TaxID=931172 RepID=A0AAV6V3R6_9ARAC|nr:hypothetical protein JTE90_014392 [Oedothorax gibbosus]
MSLTFYHILCPVYVGNDVPLLMSGKSKRQLIRKSAFLQYLSSDGCAGFTKSHSSTSSDGDMSPKKSLGTEVIRRNYIQNS